MADTLALEKLRNDVIARFVLDGTVADQPFGWRVPEQHAMGPRITWTPGDPSGNAGVIGPARGPGRTPQRAIATMRELFTCIISSSDPGAPENEVSQYKATRILYDAWLRALHLAAHGTYSIERSEWLITKNDRRFGTAMRVVCSIDAMIPDQALEGVSVDTSAVIATSELVVTETQMYVAGPAAAPASEDPQ